MDEYQLQVSAMLGAHERIIRDLLINVIGSLPKLESYMKEMRSRTTFSTPSGLHPVEIDQLNQMISETIDKTLKGAREDLIEALRRQNRQSGG